MKTKVAIVGMVSGCEKAPYGDSQWEIWGLNDLYRVWPSTAIADRWFELHGDTQITRQRREPDHWARLAVLDIPVYTFHSLPTVPKAKAFPLEQALSHGRDYFACTMAYQIAFALALGFDTIGLYGTPLQYGREAIVERPCVEWWCGFAQGKGVDVVIEHSSAYGLGYQPYRYALDDLAERRYTYESVAAHARTAARWLPEEEARLLALA